MPRANRHFLPGYVWHITHQRRSSRFQSFQTFQSFNRFAPFKASRQFKVQGSRVQGKSNSIGTSKAEELTESVTVAVTCGVFEAKKRFELSVLNYMVTSNHIHLLVKDTGANVIAQSMQLIPGRTVKTLLVRSLLLLFCYVGAIPGTVYSN